MEKEIQQPLQDIEPQKNPDREEENLINYILNRQIAMDTQRMPWLAKWNRRDLMFQANLQQPVYDNMGKAVVNLPSEQQLIQAYLG